MHSCEIPRKTEKVVIWREKGVDVAPRDVASGYGGDGVGLDCMLLEVFPNLMIL